MNKQRANTYGDVFYGNNKVDYHAIANKLREQTPAPTFDMAPDDWAASNAIWALARALDSMPEN